MSNGFHLGIELLGAEDIHELQAEFSSPLPSPYQGYEPLIGSSNPQT